ncbi:MAG: CoA transferase, partial [Pararhodobacter sp.]|nr:CoA transferase [Pararhodobacter sp.]
MLEGVRIIEIEGIGPGPFAGMMLADLGAEVTVVQRPGGPGLPGMPARNLLDRGKRTIALDMKSESDRDVVGGG